jgi:hypothetical protein
MFFTGVMKFSLIGCEVERSSARRVKRANDLREPAIAPGRERNVDGATSMAKRQIGRVTADGIGAAGGRTATSVRGRFYEQLSGKRPLATG